MRLRILIGSALFAVPLLAMLPLACERDGPDVREPLGARLAGVGRSALPLHADTARARTVIAATASLAPATYTTDQATRGADVYRATCARCHPPGQLDGENFAAGWNEARASTLFITLRNTMPQDRPGSLTDAQYADVVAYMLQRNGVAPGASALPTDSAALRELRIDLPTTRPPGANP